jgi:hypothetical protein
VRRRDERPARSEDREEAFERLLLKRLVEIRKDRVSAKHDSEWPSGQRVAHVFASKLDGGSKALTEAIRAVLRLERRFQQASR